MGLCQLTRQHINAKLHEEKNRGTRPYNPNMCTQLHVPPQTQKIGTEAQTPLPGHATPPFDATGIKRVQ